MSAIAKAKASGTEKQLAFRGKRGDELRRRVMENLKGESKTEKLAAKLKNERYDVPRLLSRSYCTLPLLWEVLTFLAGYMSFLMTASFGGGGSSGLGIDFTFGLHTTMAVFFFHSSYFLS